MADQSPSQRDVVKQVSSNRRPGLLGLMFAGTALLVAGGAGLAGEGGWLSDQISTARSGPVNAFQGTFGHIVGMAQAAGTDEGKGNNGTNNGNGNGSGHDANAAPAPAVGASLAGLAVLLGGFGLAAWRRRKH